MSPVPVSSCLASVLFLDSQTRVYQTARLGEGGVQVCHTCILSRDVRHRGIFSGYETPVAAARILGVVSSGK